MRQDAHYLVEQIAHMRSEIAELKSGRSTYRTAQVLTADAGTGTFSAALPTGETIAGLSAPVQFLPDPGQWVQLRLDGATPLYEPAGIAANAITTRELSDDAVTIDQLAFNIADYTGGTKVWFGPTTPTAMAVGELWLKRISAGPPPSYDARRWDGAAWTLTADQTGTVAALLIAEAAQAAVDIGGRTIRQAASPTGLGALDKVIWVDSDDNNRSYLWTGSGFTPRVLGDGSFQTDNLVAANVLATGTVTAGLLESIMVLSTTIIAGEPAGQHARMTPTGFRVFRPDANGDGVPDEAIRLGTGSNDTFAIIKSNGSLAASIDSAGNVNAAQGNFQNLQIGAPDQTGQGGTLLQILDRRGRGYEGRWGGRYVDSPDCVPGAGVGVFEIGCRLDDGRMYRIHTSPLRIATSNNGNVHEVQIRATFGDLNGSAAPAPSITSPVIARAQMVLNNGGNGETLTINKLMWPGGTPGTFRNWRFLMTMAMAGTGNTVMRGNTSGDAMEMWIEDVGPGASNLQQVNWGGGTSTVTAPPPPPAPPPTRYTRSWVCNWHQNWKPNGAFIDLPGASQGLDPVNGNMRSYLGFSGTDLQGTGLTIDTAMINATVESVSLYLYSNHWWFNSGGDAVIGMHGYRDPAPSFGGGNEWMVGGVHFNKPGSNWVNLGVPGVNLQNFANGTWKGIMLGAAGAGDQAHYGRFDAENNNGQGAVLSITYH